MKIPGAVQVGSAIYTVVLQERPLDNERAVYGKVDHTKRVITIDPGCSTVIQEETLFHELLHVISMVWNLDLSEHTVAILEVGLLDTLRRNTLDFVNLEVIS